MKRFIYILLLSGVVLCQRYPGRNLLEDLDDVSISTPDTGSVLLWDGGVWIDSTVSGGSDSVMYSDTSGFSHYADSAGYAPTCNPLTKIELCDEFLCGSGETGEVGLMGWSFGNCLFYPITSIQNHPGLIRMRSPNSSGGIGYAFQASSSADGLIHHNDLWEFTFLIRITDTTLCNVFVGAQYELHNTPLTPKENYGFFYCDSISSNWLYITSDGVNKTITDSGILANQETWYLLKCKRTSSGVHYYIADTLRDSINTTLPDREMNYGFHIQTKSAAYRYIEIDFFRMKLEGISR